MLRQPLIRKHRTAARVALYLAPLVVILGLWGVIRLLPKLDLDLLQPWRHADYEQIEAVRVFQEYLRVDTSYPDGNEIAGAELLARLLETEGIPVHVERLGRRNANVWAILEGEDPQALVLHNHIDVDAVPNPAAWKFPPFAGQIHLPWIFGRGAFDMKSVAIAQLMAMIKLKREGKPLRRSLIFLGTGDEETGSHLGTRWFLRQHPELAARFYAVLTEGGVVEAVDQGEVKYWGTEVCQKRLIFVDVCHDSRERLEQLSLEIVRGLDTRLKPRLSPMVATFLRRYAPSRSLELYRNLFAQPEKLLQGFALEELPPFARALLTNEVGVQRIEKDPEGGHRMTLSLLLLPDVEFQEGWDELLPPWMIHDLPLQVSYRAPIVEPSPPDHPVFQTIDALMRREMPEIEHGPYVVPWSVTDARFFREAGIPTYGFTPFLILSTDTLQMRGVNERIVAPSFVDGVELYGRLVHDLVAQKEN